MKKLFLLGCGYVASRFVDSFGQSFDQISLVSRSPSEKIPRWQDINHHFVIPDATTHILITIPPHQGEDVLCGKVKKYISQLKNLQWVGYLSATSVYGDYKGDWVKEDSVLKSVTSSGRKRIASEEKWSDVFQNQMLNIYRLSGIYGEGKSTIDRIISGKAQSIRKEGHYFSRIHVVDIVNILYQSMINGDKGQIYNLADDNPAFLHEVVNYGAHIMGVDTPVVKNIHDLELSERMKEFFSENKKIDNTKVKNRLNYILQYPSYREGLKDIWKKYCDREN